ncbi:MAG TPA: formylglycine-generating enzyme family protein, partial [Polyangiaceae bacterium]|nr:formylglycine-generating enzyme family protein [Polyangiaceae bacterium]
HSCDVDGTWTASPGSNESLPINCVNWQEAYAFCIWDGGFLPTEAEWEYAVAGGSEQRVYPWGSTDPGTNNEYAIDACQYPSPATVCGDLTSVAPVGTATLGAGRWGQLDLEGELWEWNLDWYNDYVDPWTDATNLSPSSGGRVIRGGGDAWDGSDQLDSQARYDAVATERWRIIGFRCARAP